MRIATGRRDRAKPPKRIQFSSITSVTNTLVMVGTRNAHRVESLGATQPIHTHAHSGWKIEFTRKSEQKRKTITRIEQQQKQHEKRQKHDQHKLADL